MSTTDLDTLDLQDQPIPPSTRMSEDEFDQWRDEFLRGEWVDGKVEFMAPANNQHVQLVVFLIKLLDTFAEQRQAGKAFGSELAVKLPGQRRRRVPDVAFLISSRLELLRPTYVDGAPDLIMEVVSPDSVGRDWRTKYQEYEKAGVREYWILDPAQEVVEAYVLSEAKMYRQLPEAEGRIASEVLPGFYLKSEWLWLFPFPRIFDLMKEFGVLD